MQNSMAVFRSFIVAREDGSLDASGILSRECYLTWLAIRKHVESDQEARRYQRTLSSHIGGVDGRLPFDRREEEAVLLVVRQKQRWDCFPEYLSIGCTGYRSKGFHEKNSNAFKQPIAGLSGGKFQDKDFAVNLAKKVQDMVTTSPKLDVEFYVQVGNLLRFVFLARTPVCSREEPSPALAREVCHELGETYSEDDSIVIMDLTAKDYSNGLVLAQNLTATEQFGNLLAGECDKLPFNAGDAFKVVLALSNAFHQPGTWIPVTNIPYVVTTTSQQGQGACYYSHFLVDERTFLFVFRGTLLDDTC
ncbi:hypothetical protein BASA81_009885 [Batrachochytrium salamandrivorans]|nr:hypothetical protein BASA81_009885 [Batrachochytrium salamandrivorans]